MSLAMAIARYAGWRGSLSEESPRRRSTAALAGFIAGTASRHLPSSIEESAAGTSSSLPLGCRLQYQRPRSCISWPPARGCSRSASNYLPPRLSPSESTAMIQLFCAQVFGIRKGGDWR